MKKKIKIKNKQKRKNQKKEKNHEVHKKVIIKSISLNDSMDELN